jgi:hypothetical protein
MLKRDCLTSWIGLLMTQREISASYNNIQQSLPHPLSMVAFVGYEGFSEVKVYINRSYTHLEYLSTNFRNLLSVSF